MLGRAWAKSATVPKPMQTGQEVFSFTQLLVL